MVMMIDEWLDLEEPYAFKLRMFAERSCASPSGAPPPIRAASEDLSRSGRTLATNHSQHVWTSDWKANGARSVRGRLRSRHAVAGDAGAGTPPTPRTMNNTPGTSHGAHCHCRTCTEEATAMPTAGGPQPVDQNVAWAATMGAAWAAHSKDSPEEWPKAGAGAVGRAGAGRAGRGWDEDDKSSSEKPTSSNRRPTSATNRLPRTQGGQHRRKRCAHFSFLDPRYLHVCDPSATCAPPPHRVHRANVGARATRRAAPSKR